MRPVNLIPPEQRRGGTSVRSGPIAYLLVGALALALAAVTMVVLANNKIGDRQAKVAELQREDEAIKSRTDELSPFVQFAAAERQRTNTIRSLANSRFDWERVMRELSLVLPKDVSLTDLTATSPGATSPDASATTTGTTSAPSVEMTGCAQGHEGVAGFLGALRNIDGVTSVDLQSSERSSDTSGAGSTTAASSDCRTNGLISQFTVTVVFGAAPAAPASGASASAAPATTPTSTPTSTTAVPAADTTGTTASGG